MTDLPPQLQQAAGQAAFTISMVPDFAHILDNEDLIVAVVCNVAEVPECFDPTDEARAAILKEFWAAFEAAQ